MYASAIDREFDRAAHPYGKWWEDDAAPSVDTTLEEPVAFKTGDRMCDDSGLNTDPSCRTYVPICGMRRVGAMIRGGDANGPAAVSAWQVTISPNVSEYFLPRAVRMQVVDNLNLSVAQWLFITGVTINNFPQESVQTPNAGAGTRIGFSSEEYTAPDGYGVPVPWGIFSQGALLKLLQINGFNFFPTGALLIVGIWGHPLSRLPDNVELGCPMPEAQKTEIASVYAQKAA